MQRGGDSVEYGVLDDNDQTRTAEKTQVKLNRLINNHRLISCR